MAAKWAREILLFWQVNGQYTIALISLLYTRCGSNEHCRGVQRKGYSACKSKHTVKPCHFWESGSGWKRNSADLQRTDLWLPHLMLAKSWENNLKKNIFHSISFKSTVFTKSCLIAVKILQLFQLFLWWRKLIFCLYYLYNHCFWDDKGSKVTLLTSQLKKNP